MVSVRKSPNMISITGRIPVIAAPTPTPVKPASEIGVSITRETPNSCTKPDNTLKGVPASATSSPSMHTRASRRISSASASLTAWAKVNSRCAVSGIYVLCHFIDGGIRRSDGEIYGGGHLLTHLFADDVKRLGIREAVAEQPVGENFQRIAVGLPLLFFLLGTVVFAIDVADVMPGVAVGVADQEGRTLPGTRASNHFCCYGVHGAHVLPVHGFGRDAEGGAARQ